MNSGFKDALKDSGLSMYSLAKQTDVPYTTINRLVNERLSINNCNAGAVFKIASALGVRMEDLMNNEQVYTIEEIAELIAPGATVRYSLVDRWEKKLSECRWKPWMEEGGEEED